MAKEAIDSIDNAQSYSEKYGAKFDEDRYKLEAGIEFLLTSIPEIKQSLKKPKDGKEPYDIVHLDGIGKDGQPVKYYSASSVIARQSKEMRKDAKPDGTLVKPMRVKVVKRKGESGSYICFV